MGKYIRKCSKGAGEVTVMEVAQLGARTRARAMAAEEAADNSGTVLKKRKIGGDGEVTLRSSNLVQIDEVRGIEDVLTTHEEFVDSGEDLSDPYAEAAASCCSSYGSTEKLKIADLEEESVEIETVARYDLGRRESTMTSEFKAESGELEPSTAKPSTTINSRRRIPDEKIPPSAEIEEFFAVAERDLHNRFKDEYNYDIVKDIPLTGRFEWVQLKP